MRFTTSILAIFAVGAAALEKMDCAYIPTMHAIALTRCNPTGPQCVCLSPGLIDRVLLMVMLECPYHEAIDAATFVINVCTKSKVELRLPRGFEPPELDPPQLDPSFSSPFTYFNHPDYNLPHH